MKTREDSKQFHFFFENTESGEGAMHCGGADNKDAVAQAIARMIRTELDEMTIGGERSIVFELSMTSMTPAEIAELPDL